MKETSLKINNLLSSIGRIHKHHQRIKELKGETFNVFSILKMESKENGTHSAFLKELLDPKGSHLKGSTFLYSFLSTIENTSIDTETAQVKVEHYCGERDDINKTGGRIDIYIWDKKGNSISIENKIYAEDQNVQIERYCNFNKEKNTVYYLNLNGNNPSKESAGELKKGKDYYIISYEQHILSWLQICLKESVDFPILRESIKQYIILIKKLTHTMNEAERDELYDVLLKNHHEASLITNHFNAAVINLLNKFRNQVASKLEANLKEEFKIIKGSDVARPNSQIWLMFKGKEETKIFFGIQNFSIKKDNFFENLFIGIFVMKGLYIPEYAQLGEKNSDYWTGIQAFSDYDNYRFTAANSEFIKKLHTSAKFRDGLVDHIVEEAIQYIDKKKDAVSTFLKEI